MSEPVVLGVERVNNPHLIPIFEELRQQPGIQFTGCVLQPVPGYRAELGWTELPEDAPFLQPFRRDADRQRYLELARTADAVIWPGLKFSGSVRLLLGRNLRGKLNIIWAERFAARRERSSLQTLAMKGVVRLLNSRNMHLMTLGAGAEQDYRGYGATRWRIWQYGYAVQPLEPEPVYRESSRNEPLRLVFIGALRSKKGVDVLLRALGRRELAGGAWRLRLVGEGRERSRLEALAVDLEIAEQVEFAGSVSHDEIASVYRAADVLVLPSQYEGWGAVVNEAMEHGAAVVGSAGAGSVRMLVAHGSTGFVFSPGDQVALAEHLAQLVAEPEMCVRMGRAGRERIRQFRPAVSAERVASLLRGLTGHGEMPEFAEGLCCELS